MRKPNSKDLARAAGVSLATVDRVLNARDGVRRATVERVNAAVERIGFVRDTTAANLARGREFAFAFVLPDRTDAFVDAIADAVAEAGAASIHLRANVRLHRVRTGDPHEVVRALAALIDARVDGIAVMAPESAQVRDAIHRAQREGIAVVTLVSDQPSAARERFVGINDMAAGRTAATLIGRFSGPQPGRVVVVADTIRSRDSLDRRAGFDRVMASDFPWLAVAPTVETHADAERTAIVLRRVLADDPQVRAIYLMGTTSAPALRVLADLQPGRGIVTVAHELTDVTRGALEDGTLSAVIHQDVGHLVRSALRVLRGKAERSATIEAQERIRIEIALWSNLPPR